MTIFDKNLTLPTTLTDLLDARTEALRLHHDARRANQLAFDTLAKMGDYLSPQSMDFKESVERATQDMDCRLWKRAFDLTGFRQLMDAEAVRQFEDSLYRSPPEFTEGNIRATFLELSQTSGELFRRGIVNVFRFLPDHYKTNGKEPFRVGRKIVKSWMVGPSYTRGLCVRHGTSSNQLDDIDRVFKTLDGKKFHPRSLETALNARLMDREVFEDDYYRIKGFKNGNLHMEFKRADLLEKVNDLIAEHYGENVLARDVA